VVTIPAFLAGPMQMANPGAGRSGGETWATVRRARMAFDSLILLRVGQSLAARELGILFLCLGSPAVNLRHHVAIAARPGPKLAIGCDGTLTHAISRMDCRECC
jgi:hypothetical protein